MNKSGFGNKGSVRSSVEKIGKRTYAQSFGSPDSALKSLIPYSPYNLIFSTLNFSSVKTQISGATTLVHKWIDINNYANLTQSSDSSKPTIDTTNILGGRYFGVRGQTDDLMTTDTKNNSDLTQNMTTILFARCNHSSSLVSSLIFSPYSQAGYTYLSQYTNYGLSWWWNAQSSPNNTMNYTEYAPARTGIIGINNPGYGTSGQPTDMFLKSGFLVQEGTYDSGSRQMTTSLRKGDGTLYRTATINYTSSFYSGSGWTQAQWDGAFVSGNMTPKYLQLFAAANGAVGVGYYTADTTIYTFLKINSILTTAQINSITSYIKSAYGAK